MCCFNGLWLGKFDDLCYLSIASYLANDHRFRLWSYDRVKVAGAEIADASAIVPETIYRKWAKLNQPHKWQTFSNYFRYKLIHEYGGWWVDLDSVAVKHHDFDAEYVFCGIATPTRPQLEDIVGSDGNIIPGCFKAPKGAGFLGHLTTQFDNQGFTDAICPDFAVWGTVALTTAIYKFGLQHYKLAQNVFVPFPPQIAKDLLVETPDIPEWAYSVHFYNFLTSQMHRGGLFDVLWDRYMN